MVIDPGDGQTVYAIVRDKGIYKTTNGGSIWNLALSMGACAVC